MLSQTTDHAVDIRQTLFGSVAPNHYIIDVDQAAISDKIAENVAHHSLEKCRCVLQSERHSKKLILAFFCHKDATALGALSKAHLPES